MEQVIEVLQSRTFRLWFAGLRDPMARKRILVRIGRLERGLFGDVKPVGAGVSDLRIDHGPGYRIYLTRRGETVVLLLCGGDKSSQARDIEAARRIIGELP
jgi:putative addiction module killer protein